MIITIQSSDRRIELHAYSANFKIGKRMSCFNGWVDEKYRDTIVRLPNDVVEPRDWPTRPSIRYDRLLTMATVVAKTSQ